MSYCKPFKRGVSWRSQNFGANATIYGPHSGNDDAANIGTPVHAAGDGVVDWAGEFDDTYLDNLLWLLKMGGNILVLNCGANEPSFVYGHLDRFTVKRGDRVRKGQVIAYSGNTGTATTGAHLHTEAIPPGYSLNSSMLGRVNPDIYLTEWPEDVNTGSLTPAGETITPLQEDTLSEAQADRIIKEVNAYTAALLVGKWKDDKGVMHSGGNLVSEQNQREIRTIPSKVWAVPILRGGKQVSALQDMANGTTASVGSAPAIAQILENTSAEDVAATIPDDIAQQVIDALVARLTGATK